MKDLVELWKYIATFETNPERIVRFMKMGDDQRRPMESYIQNNFDSLLYQFLLSHAVYKIDNYKPKRNIEISSASLDRYKRSKRYFEKNPSVLRVVSRAHAPNKERHSSHRSNKRTSRRRSSRRSHE